MKLKYLKNVATLALSAEKCIACGRCGEVCPHDVFDFEGKRARIGRKDSCMECGACALNCPAGAIEVRAGVGCASAIINGWMAGGGPSCDCSGGCC
jgi:NAD-dependent dihydropyrimidine dehydrogenase PreA subunit